MEVLFLHCWSNHVSVFGIEFVEMEKRGDYGYRIWINSYTNKCWILIEFLCAEWIWQWNWSFSRTLLNIQTDSNNDSSISYTKVSVYHFYFAYVNCSTTIKHIWPFLVKPLVWSSRKLGTFFHTCIHFYNQEPIL